MTTRAALDAASRIVVKVGSSSISGEREHQVPGLVDALAAWRTAGKEVVLVSSGRQDGSQRKVLIEHANNETCNWPRP